MSDPISIGNANALLNISNWILGLLTGRKVSPEQKLTAQAKWKNHFEENLLEHRIKGLHTEVIVHDVSRINIYPGADYDFWSNLTGRISPWFRAGIDGTYHEGGNAGIYIGLRYEEVIQDNETSLWRHIKYDGLKKLEEGVKVSLIGLVPYEFIEHVDWNGDDYYSKIHLYLHFKRKGMPYKKLAYFKKIETKTGGYWEHIADYEPVYNYMLKIGQIKKLGYYDRLTN